MRRSHFFIRADELMDGIPMTDFHIHTRYSDGNSTVAEYVEAAANRGFSSICFTDHVDYTTMWFGAYSDEIAHYQDACGDMKIVRGIEVRAKDHDGKLNAPMGLLDNAEVVIGVVHSIPSEDGNGKYPAYEFSQKKLLELEYTISLNLLDNERVSVLGHPMSNYEKLYGPVPEGYYMDIILKAKSAGKAVEISAKYKNDFKNFLRLCLEVNPLVSLGSDAHSVLELGAICEKLSKEMVGCRT